MIHAISNQFANLISEELHLERGKIRIVSYGLEVLLGGLIKTAFFVVTPLSMGLFKLFATVYITSALLRLSSGGFHCSSFLRCLLSTLLIFLVLATGAKYHLPRVASIPGHNFGRILRCYIPNLYPDEIWGNLFPFS